MKKLKKPTMTDTNPKDELIRVLDPNPKRRWVSEKTGNGFVIKTFGTIIKGLPFKLK